MVDVYVAPLIITLFWAFIGIGCPLLVRGPSKGVTQCCLMLIAGSCWIFWLCCYMTQLHPLIGPKLKRQQIMIAGREWGNLIEDSIDIEYH